MKMNDNTILRIKVPAHLYEAVKAQLTLNEAQNFGMPGAKTVKVKDSSSGDKPKKTSAPKAKSAPKKANAPQKATGAMFDKETEKMGAGVSETKKADKGGHKKMGLEELQALAELLNNEITKLQEKSHDKEEKAPVEEEKEKMEEGIENINEEDYDKLADMKRAGVYSKEDIANYLGLDLEKDIERINYWYEKLGGYRPSYAAGRGRTNRRRW